jgi:hypothetical protein
MIRFPARARAAALLLSLLALAGCERTLFERSPADAGCDPALAGRWLSQGRDAKDEGELVATIDAQCRLTTVEHKAEGPRRSAPTTLRTGQADGVRYLWLEAAWANASFEIERNALDHDGDIYLFAYRLRGDRLDLAAPPHRAVAHRVLDKDVPGEVLKQDDELTVRVTGERDALRKMLRSYRIFRFDDALRFRRARGGEVRRNEDAPGTGSAAGNTPPAATP